MSKSKTLLPPTRPLYAALLIILAFLLWLLALPRPGVRETRLKAVLVPEADTPRPAVPETIRVATYNLEHFTDGHHDGPDRTPAIFAVHAQGAAAIIAEANPDILFLQEIENGRTLIYLNSLLPNPYPYIYISRLRRSSGLKDKLNMALLSRLHPQRVRQLSFHALPYPGRPSRGVISAEFALDDLTTLLSYGMHLKSNFGEAPNNRAQRTIALHHTAADAANAALRNQPRQTVTLMLGDTNVDPETEQFADDPSLTPLAGAYLDLWLGRPLEERTTIPTREAGETGDPLLVFPPAAFDRVFASRNLGGADAWLVQPPQVIQKGTDTANNLTPPGVNGHVTDHFLVYVDLIRNPEYTPPPLENSEIAAPLYHPLSEKHRANKL